MSTGQDDVALVLAFLNTCDVEDGTDVLDREADWLAWVAERRLGRADPLAETRVARDALRAAVSCDAGDRAAADPPAVPVQVELDAGTPTLRTASAVAAAYAAAARLVVDGEWPRIKICPAADCRWAFYDRSRNRSRNWCSMQVCGNRAKARQFRQRTRS